MRICADHTFTRCHKSFFGKQGMLDTHIAHVKEVFDLIFSAEISALFSQKREERERIVQQLAEIQCALRDLMVIKKSDNPRMVFFTDIQYAEELSYSFSMQKISDLIKSTEQARLALLRNANVKLTITNFLSGLI
jgi:hypothetical protein